MKSFNIDMEYDNEKTHRGGATYSYNSNPKKIQVFNKVPKLKEIKWLQLISDIHFFPYPQSFSVETQVYRLFSESKLRNKSTGDIIIDPTFIKAFEWSRNYTLRWNLWESFNFDY